MGHEARGAEQCHEESKELQGRSKSQLILKRNASVRLNDVNDNACGRHPTIYFYIFLVFIFFKFETLNFAWFFFSLNNFCFSFCFSLGLYVEKNRENREN